MRSSEHFDSSIDTLDESLRGDAQNAKWRRDLARSLLVSADFESRRGGLAVATEKLAKVETHIDALIKQEPANRETRQLSVYADVCIAQVKMYNDREASLAHWRSARQKLDQHFGTSTDPRILHLKAVVLAQLGQKDEARDIQERLRAMGYQSRAT